MLSTLFGLGICLLSSVPTAFASPVQLQTREISSDLLSNFELFSQFAALSACDQNINSTQHKLTCDYGTCGLVEADDTENIYVFHSSSGPTGYIALDHTKKLIVLTFRTSVSTNDLAVDKKTDPTYIEDICPGCWAHTGFWDYWQDVSKPVIAQLTKATKAHPSYHIALVGHSLGGGVATVAGTALRKRGFKLDIWTFGSPKVGNYKLAEYITNVKPRSVYRATHYTDSVPKAPQDEKLDYTQTSPEYWISVPLKEDVTAEDVIYVEGINSQEGNAGHGSNSTGGMPDANHLWYFGPMQVCTLPADFASSAAA
ncbi:hypothetical protein N7452_002760 [Penicillium brevicompactum]|uniref:Fungal lipase-type domain-containing protein n=1 Tax=Penicillium brevicompactum TaxID=5074 RepID=A0A9W9UJI3_PENBR|nr:hypothetical protein N7452_002760 [Penicillium brevicompactum]